MTRYARVDASRYPFIKIIGTGETANIAKIQLLEQELDDALAKHEGPYVTMVLGDTKFITAEGRIALGNMSKRLAGKYARRHAGSVMVVNNPLTRMMVQGIRVISKDNWAPHTVKSRLDAELMAEELLATYMRSQKQQQTHVPTHGLGRHAALSRRQIA